MIAQGVTAGRAWLSLDQVIERGLTKHRTKKSLSNWLALHSARHPKGSPRHIRRVFGAVHSEDLKREMERRAA